MDQQTLTLGGVIGVAVVVVVVALRSKRIRARIRAPGVDATVDGSDDPTPAIIAENIRSHAGAVRATDLTGRGVHARGVEARKDVEIASEARGADRGPKA
jgi:hypothetical protein